MFPTDVFSWGLGLTDLQSKIVFGTLLTLQSHCGIDKFSPSYVRDCLITFKCGPDASEHPINHVESRPFATDGMKIGTQEMRTLLPFSCRIAMAHLHRRYAKRTRTVIEFPKCTAAISETSTVQHCRFQWFYRLPQTKWMTSSWNGSWENHRGTQELCFSFLSTKSPTNHHVVPLLLPNGCVRVVETWKLSCPNAVHPWQKAISSVLVFTMSNANSICWNIFWLFKHTTRS